MNWWIAYSLLFCRAAGLTAALPLGAPQFGGLKLAMAAGLAFVFQGDFQETRPVDLGSYGAEVLAGFLLGIPAAVMVGAASSMGELLDGARGQSLSLMYDGMSEANQGQLGFFCGRLSGMVLLGAGGLEIIFSAFGQSARLSSPGSLTLLRAPELSIFLLEQSWLGLRFAVGLFLPIAAAFVIVDVGSAVCGRFLPGLSLSNECFLLKTAGAFLFLMGLTNCFPPETAAAVLGKSLDTALRRLSP